MMVGLTNFGAFGSVVCSICVPAKPASRMEPSVGRLQSSARIMAEAFPDSTFTGYDYHAVQSTPAPESAAGDGVLVDPSWLEAHLYDPTVRVVEVDVSRLAYDQWHIDGAVLWNVYADLKDADYRLADGPALQRLLARSGIGPGSTVVFYGYAAVLGFWLMKFHGHADVRILDCSRDTWQHEDRPRSSTVTAPAATAYVLRQPDERLRADHTAVRKAIGDPGTTIADVRTEAEYRGERFWPSGGMEPGGRAGHVPSAVHQPIDGLYDDRGSFRSAADLRRAFSAVDLGGHGELITYCTIGGRACRPPSDPAPAALPATTVASPCTRWRPQ